jgi:Reverse transcriptase (RNA-dependent DNA polymerase)
LHEIREDFKKRGFILKEGHKSIHDTDSIRFSTEVIGISDWNRDVLENGLKLEFKQEVGKYREQNNQSAVQNMEVLREKVTEWMAEGHVEKITEPAWCCNPMTVAVKYDPVKDETKLRPCIDLSRHVNKLLVPGNVKMDDLSVAEELISQGDYMASFDLANQFFHVQLRPEDRKFFGFALPGKDGIEEFYRFTVMAYGFRTATEVVTRLLRPVKAYLHELGIKLSIFVDDGRVSAQLEQDCREQFQFVLEVLQLCGWNIQWKKTSTEPNQSLLHLGFVTDSVHMRYYLPKEKEGVVLKLLQEGIDKGMEGQAVPAIWLASLLGKINSMRRSHGATIAVMSRSCQHLLGEAVLEKGWQTQVTFTYEAVRELQYLLDNLARLNGQHIQTQEARTTVISLRERDELVKKIEETGQYIQNLFVSDASDNVAFVYRADGEFMTVKEFEFTELEKSTSSGMREVLAVQKMLKEQPGKFEEFKGGVVYWQTDSRNSYIFLSRGSRKPHIQDVVADIKLMERELDITILPVWTPREHSRILLADMGSKLHTSTDEWCLDRGVLADVCTTIGFVPEVDCCATAENTVCDKYFSKIPQLGTSGINFLSQKLEQGTKYYCCPPIKMIPKAVNHLLESQKIECLLIVPKWTSKPFWVSLTNNKKFQAAVQKELFFKGKFFMSNNSESLFTRCKNFEMVAFLLKT